MATAAELAILLTCKDMASKQLAVFGKELGGMGAAGKVAAVGLAGLATAGLGLVAGIGKAVGEAMGFESAMSAVAAVAGGTDADLKRLSDTALQLGQDTTLSGVGATDAARAMRELAAAGLSVDDIVRGAALGALRLASAGGIDVARAAEIAAMALANFGLEGKDTARVADLFAAAANSSAISVDDIAESMKYVGPIAASMGMDIEDVTAAIAALGNQGIKGTQAGTALRSMMVSLAKPSKEANKIIKELGLSFFNASGEMKDLGGIAEELKTGMAGLTDQQRAAALATLFGNEALTAATVLYGEGAEGIAKWLDEVTNGATAAEVGAKRNDNLKGSLEALQSAAETALITFGMGLTPALKDLTTSFAEGVSAAIPFLTALGAGLGRALTTGIGVLTQFGTYVAGVVTAVVGAWQKLQAGEITLAQFIGGMKTLATTVLGDLGILFGKVGDLLGPFLTRVGEGLRLALPIIGAELVKLGQAFGAWVVTTAIPYLQTNLPLWLAALSTWVTSTALPAIGEFVSSIGAAFGGWITGTAIPYLQTNLPLWLAAVQTWITGTAVPAVTGFLVAVGTAFGDWVATTAVPWVQQNLPGYLAAIGTWVTSTAVPAVTDFLVAVGTAFGTWVEVTAIPAVLQKLSEWKAAVESWIGTTALPGIEATANNLAPALSDWIPNEAVPRINEYMPLVVDAVAQGVISGDAETRTVTANWGRSLGEAFGAALLDAGGAAISAAVAHWETVLFLPMAAMPALLFATAMAMGQRFAAGLEDGLLETLAAVGRFGVSFFLAFQALTNPMFSFWLNFGIGMMTKLREGLEGGWGTVQSFVASIPGRILGALGDMGSVLYQSGVDLVMGLARGIIGAMPQAVGAAQALAGQVASALGGALQIRSPSRVTMAMGREIVNGLVEGMDEKQQDAAKKAADVASAIAKAITDTLGALRALANFDFAADSPTGEAMGWFRHLTESLIATMQEAAAGFEDEALEHVGKFADTVGKVGGSVKNAVEGLMALGKADWANASPSGSAMAWFTHLVSSLVQNFATAAQRFDEDALAAAGKFAESAGKVLGVIKTGVEGLQALTTLVVPSKQAVDDFLAMALYVVQRFGEVAATLETEGIEKTRAFSEAAKEALAATKVGTDAFKAFEELVVPSKEAIDTLLAGIVYVTNRFGEIASEIGTEGLTKAQEFATAAGNVFTTMKGAIDLMNSLEGYKDSATSAINQLVEGVKAAIQAAIGLVGEAKTLHSKGDDFLREMQAAAAAFAEGMALGNGIGGAPVATAPLGVGGGNGGGSGTPGGVGGAPIYNVTVANPVLLGRDSAIAQQLANVVSGAQGKTISYAV